MKNSKMPKTLPKGKPVPSAVAAIKTGHPKGGYKAK